MIKLRRKSIDLSPKLIVVSDVETTFRRHTFLYGELQCLPRGDPRNLCASTRTRLLATRSLKRNLKLINLKDQISFDSGSVPFKKGKKLKIH